MRINLFTDLLYDYFDFIPFLVFRLNILFLVFSTLCHFICFDRHLDVSCIDVSTLYHF